MEDYGVLVGRTLVDASSWSARILMVNSSSEVVVLPSFSCVGYLVPVSAVSVACTESVLLEEGSGVLPDHLEDIITGSHPLVGSHFGVSRIAGLRTEQTCIKEMLVGGGGGGD